MIRINEAKTLTKHIVCDCKYKLMVENNVNQKQNNGKCLCECENPIQHCLCKKYNAWNPSTCGFEINNYLKHLKTYAYTRVITDDAVTECNEIIDMTETLPANSNDEKAIHKIDYFILHTFY